MLTIKDFKNTVCYLSDNVYKIKDNDHPSFDTGYGEGDLVRLISGIDGSKRPGYHPRNDYYTVCRVDAEQAEFVGIKKSSLEKVS